MHGKTFLIVGVLLALAWPAWAGIGEDTIIHGKISAALLGDPVTKARQIDIEVVDGVVQLNGTVDSADALRRAEQLAAGVTGVRDVRNNLRVGTGSRAAGTVIDDSVITSKIKAALMADSTTKAYQINVTTRDGVVSLSGFVDSETAKQNAERIARTVDGTRDIRNDLEIRD